MMVRTLYKIVDAWEDKPAQFIFSATPRGAERLATLYFRFVIPCAEIASYSWEAEEAGRRG